MAKILEASEYEGDTMCTVRSKRGEEYIINVDELARVWADLLSDEANEARGGWSLSVSWFECEINRINNAAVRKP